MDEASLLTLRNEIIAIEQALSAKKRQLEELQSAYSKKSIEAILTQEIPSENGINNQSPPEAKIVLFRSLFKGREDIYAKRFENKKTGKSGYQPACRNEWVRGICEKPKLACGNCSQRAFEPITDEVIRNHLAGFISPKYEWKSRTSFGNPAPFVVGVYPLSQDETCNFLAVDFDKEAWQEDVKAFMDTCKLESIPSVLERSRSGNGAHIWIFFDKPVTAAKARKLGSFLMTKTLDRRPEIGLDSFDRFFPNQDTLPKGGLGNLIALPLQKAAREKNHSIFLDQDMNPYPDQWAFLSSIKKLSENKLDEKINNAVQRNELLPVVYDPVETEDESKPWERKPAILPQITEPLPQKVEIVLADQLYVSHTGLPSILRNRILRLASFANPEFYRVQRMRLPTWNKPHILYCYEFFPEYIGLPIGCLNSLIEILDHYQIKPELQNKQNRGQSINVQFIGELREEQNNAAEKLLEKQTGILSASTAFGKTVVALKIIAERKANTLILVHRKMLADQWAERINQFLGIQKKEIGCYSGTKKKLTGIIDIAVMQSVVKKNKVEDWIKNYGQIIVDECHHVSAASFEQIIRKCPAYYRLGLSATVIRKDGQHPIVLMNLGDVCYAKTNNSKDLFVQKVFTRFTNFCLSNEPHAANTTNEKPPEINEIFRSLYANEDRNKLIVQDIFDAYKEGRNCLVISERLEHLDIIKELLNEYASPIFLLKGGLGKKQVKEIMTAIQNKLSHEHIIILATGKYLGEGFDLPNLDTLFLVFPFSWRGLLIQYTGRLNRIYQGKNEIRVYDYADDQEPLLAKMYRKRLKSYKSIGFSVTNICMDTALQMYTP